jgi:hypothetical protein
MGRRFSGRPLYGHIPHWSFLESTDDTRTISVSTDLAESTRFRKPVKVGS